jgi:two-component system, response regulator, stage 0 sporulation protein F
MKNNVSVLYVDDEPINLIIFQELFKDKYRVISAESGLKGLEILEVYTDIDIVVSDMKMPAMNGLEFIRKARELRSSLIFFILSGFEITKEIQKALQEGLIKHYFQKPFKKEEIIREIQKHATL